jgi:hypothetical protein
MIRTVSEDFAPGCSLLPYLSRTTITYSVSQPPVYLSVSAHGLSF